MTREASVENEVGHASWQQLRSEGGCEISGTDAVDVIGGEREEGMRREVDAP